MEISSRPRPRQIQAGDTGRGRAATQFAARRTQVAHLGFFFFLFFLLRTPSSLGFFFFLSFFEHLLPWVFFFFFSFFSDENVGAALVVFFVFFLNVNRVLETRFSCRRHLEKVPRKRGTTHENRALKGRFRSPKSSL